MGKLRDNVTSLDFADFASSLMVAVQNGEWAAVRAGLFNDEPSLVADQSFTADGTRPQMYLAWGPTIAVAFIGGVVNLSLAQKFWLGYFRDALALTGTAERNIFTEDIASLIQDLFTQKGVGAGAPKVYVGHSFGGTVAQLCAERDTFRGGTSRGYYCSFGSPKWARSDEAHACRTVPGTRWFNSDDPMPVFPFTIRDSLATLLLLRPDMQNQLGGFVQSAGGCQLNPDGTVDPEVLPTSPTIGQILSLPLWALGSDTAITAPHGMPEYVRRIRIAAAASRQPTAATRISVETEQPASSTSRYYNQQEQRVATTVANLQAQQNQPALAVPRPQLFAYYKQGRIYPVTFGNTIVCLTSDKRTARSIARQGNVFLRHLQTMGFVDPENLLQQFTAYLAAAADPGSGFVPTMNTQLPV